MKPAFTLFLLALTGAGVAVRAQTTIADASHMPAVGYTAPVSTATSSVLPGAGGTGITWDFSGISATTVATVTVIDPATSPYISTFPTADYCLKLAPSVGSALYDYNRSSATKNESLASSYAPGSGNDYTPNPETEIPFPFAYGNSVTDTFQKTGGSANTVIITYDGFGTLKTPFGTYNNVVRMKHDYGGTDVDYKWWTTSPLFIMAVYSGSSGSYTFLGGTTTDVKPVTAAEGGTSIYPNPVQGDAVLTFNTSVGINSASLFLSDVTGKLMKTVPVTSRETNFTTIGMAPGIYFYRLVNDGANVAYGKVVIR